MKTRAELKAQAKEALKGNWKWAIGLNFIPTLLLMLVYYALIAVIILIFGEPNSVLSGLFLCLVVIAVLLFAMNLSLGIYSGYQDLIRSKGESHKKLFETAGFSLRTDRFWKASGVFAVETLFLFLWELLLVIPAIIKSYSYSQTTFILRDKFENGQTNFGVTEAITESRQLMKGHKFELFVMGLSFLGWALLCMLTLGIGYLWLTPYMGATYAAYYEELKNSQTDSLENA